MVKEVVFLSRQAICESLRKKNMNHRELTKATWKFYYAKDASPRKNPTDSTEIGDGQRVDLSGISAVAEKCKVLLWW